MIPCFHHISEVQAEPSVIIDDVTEDFGRPRSSKRTSASWRPAAALYPDLGEKVTISTGGGIEPLWSPDGSELFYRMPDLRARTRVQGPDVPGATVTATSMCVVRMASSA